MLQFGYPGRKVAIKNTILYLVTDGECKNNSERIDDE